MKTFRKIVGSTLIASPFAALYITFGVELGWVNALIPFAITAIVILVVSAGVILLKGTEAK